MLFVNRRIALLLAAAPLALCPAGRAAAQVASRAEGADAGADGGIAEIVVTAQKRTERISEVPMSITAATGDLLRERGVVSTEDLTKIVPGFTFQRSDNGTPVYTIRGVGFLDVALGSAPTVTAYVDQAPLPYSVMTRGATLDLERVEVLKGPQGTLFGQNSTGGAINYIAAKPTDDFRAGALLGYGRFNELVAEGFVSGALTERLKVRVAGRQERADGWQRSTSRPNDTLGDKRFYNGRALVDWAPGDAIRLQLNVSAWADNSESIATQFVSFQPKAPRTPANQYVYDAFSRSRAVPADNRGADWDAGKAYRGKDRFFSAALNGEARLGDQVQLNTITAYARYRTNRLADRDGTDFTEVDMRTVGVVKSFSQELRLSGTTGRARWMLGANYQQDRADESLFQDNNISNTSIANIVWTKTNVFSDQKTDIYSGFGSVDYALADTLNAHVSARYSEQQRTYEGCLADGGDGRLAAAFNLVSVILGGPGGAPAGACAVLDSVTLAPGTVRRNLQEDNLSWRAGLDWKPRAGTLVYANVSRGYKFGSFTLPQGLFSSQFNPATQEAVTAYEAGFKLSPTRRLQLNGAAFYYDYKDKQTIGAVDVGPPFGVLTQLINVPKSRVLGTELEVVAEPVRGLRLSQSVSYISSRILSSKLGSDPVTGAIVDFRGRSFPNTPKWQTVSDATVRAPLTDDLGLLLGASYLYRTATSAALADTPLFRIRGYGLLDLRVGVEGQAGWRVELWGRNITGQRYWNGVTRVTDTVTRYAGMPATYGVTFRWSL